jgi:hypothetical protein
MPASSRSSPPVADATTPTDPRPDELRQELEAVAASPSVTYCAR